NGVVSVDDQKISADPFVILETKLAKIPKQESKRDLPPFQGGIAGCFSYDLCHYLEKIPFSAKDDMNFPDMALGFYDLVIAYDHLQKKSWLISTGLPESDLKARELRAKQRCEWLLKIMREESQQKQNPTLDEKLITANFSKTDYLKAVRKAI